MHEALSVKLVSIEFLSLSFASGKYIILLTLKQIFSKGGEIIMISKKKIISIFAIVLIFGSIFALPQQAYAANGGFWGGNFFSGLIAFISQKFGLDKTQVQNAMQEYQVQVKATITPRPTMSPQDRQDREKKRLDNLVSSGKITTDQENAIISELETLRTKYNLGAQNNQTPVERKTQMDNMKNELDSWATSQGLDPKYVMPMFGRGRGGGMGKGDDGFRGRWKQEPKEAQ